MFKYGRFLILPAIALSVSLSILNFTQFIDFERVFHPALFAANPYAVAGFASPRYLPLLMWPLRFFEPHTAGAVWAGVSTAVIAYVIYRLNGDWLSYILVFTCPIYFLFIKYANVEALVLLGIVAPAPLDVLLMGIKPQTAVLAIVKRLGEYGRKQWAALAVVLGISFIAWGFWVIPMLASWIDGPNHDASVDVFPWGLIAAVVIIGLYWRRMTLPQWTITSYLVTPFITPSALFVPIALMLVTFERRRKLVVYGMIWALFLVASVMV